MVLDDDIAYPLERTMNFEVSISWIGFDSHVLRTPLGILTSVFMISIVIHLGAIRLYRNRPQTANNKSEEVSD